MTNFSPILIPTLNRFNHFRNCVESLAICTHAKQTDLFIALDYPSKESQIEGYEKIKKYIPTIEGFKKIHIIKREKNWGVPENAYDAIDTIFQQYDRIIISEDDNVFSPNFLDYINKGLTLFESNPKVSSICGYKFPFEGPESFQHSYMYSKSFSGWGYGFWRKKYTDKIWLENKDKSLSDVRKYIKNPINAYKIKDIPYALLEGLMHIVKTKTFTADRMHCFYNIHNKTYSVFPMISLVRNTGHDGTGIHCGRIPIIRNPFINQKIDTSEKFEFIEHFDFDNKFINNLVKNHAISFANLKLHHKIIRIKNYLFFWILK